MVGDSVLLLELFANKKMGFFAAQKHCTKKGTSKKIFHEINCAFF